MEYLQIAEEFAKRIWPYKEKLEVKDLMLFGSLTNNKKTSRDIDILIIHQNHFLDKFQQMLKDKKFKSALDSFLFLSNSLKNLDVLELFNKTGIEKAIKKNLIHTVYMNIKYFNNQEYREKWDSSQSNPFFTENIFKQGLLWNPLTEKYNIRASENYLVK